MSTEFLDPFVDILRDHVSGAEIRESERALQPPELWQAIADSGFADALVPEERGGAGLSPVDVQPLIVACGEYLLPPAFGHSMVARMLIASAGYDLPGDPIILWPQTPDGRLRSLVAPAACEAALALVQCGDAFALRHLLASPQIEDGFGLVATTIEDGPPLLEFTACGIDLIDMAAALTACAMVGAMSRMLGMTLEHANDRQQFGRPLGKFQTIQHQLAVAAEQVALAGVAARGPFADGVAGFDPVRVAIAKTVANQAADVLCAVAHSVHGAIGVSEEHDLQLYSRRLRRWQQSFGSDAFWARRIGAARLADPSSSVVDFLRAIRVGSTFR
ncbi:MAG: acyl-CoA dehydrogenase domain protein [Bradyrhizobium sp.]|nr:acyl-CoA dehydrogenase domain protein [Bradyrhizobium sp.]